MKQITLTIDEKTIHVPEGTTLLQAATAHGIQIPNLCYDGRVELYGACGLCVVEAEGTPKLLRACSALVREGMVVHTHTPRVDRARKVALELLLSDHDGDCKAPCTKACPANTDCQGYVGLVANGEYKEAVRVIKEKIPLPASIGRVCPHPCETECRRQFVDEPIAIAAIKGFAADMDMKSDNPYVPPVEPDTGKKVCVVGGGPGGLTVANFLRRLGHAVTVLDAMPQMGGMLRYGIPEYRLPKAILDKEIAQIEALGVVMKNGVKVGKDTTVQKLKNQYDAVVLAAGAWQSSFMHIAGESIKNVWGGIDFLREVALHTPPKIGKRVAVVGGGNTAMDACRTAVRLGAEEVYVLYRRTEAQMPAENEEIADAKAEGVTFKFLSAPIEYVEKNGKLAGATVQKMQLGEPDASGRRRPEPIAGETEFIPLDTAIVAIGQVPNLKGFEAVEATKRNTIAADETTFRTSMEGVFAVGDMTNRGASIAVAAIGEAQKAALVIDRYLDGELVPYKKPYFVERTLPQSYFDSFEKAQRLEIPKRDFDKAKHDFKEVAKGITPKAAEQEAMRCLECGCHDYYSCKLIAYANEYGVQPQRFGGEKHSYAIESNDQLITRDQNKCILCGLCVRVCEEKMGKAVLGLLGRGFNTLVQPAYALPLQNTECTMCGACEAVCPTGALRVKQPTKKRLVVKEQTKETVCNFCSAHCKQEIQYVGDTVLRAVPYGEKGILCKAGRFGILAAKQTASVPSEKTYAKFKAALWTNPDDFAVIAGPSATLEELFYLKTHFKHVYANVTKTSAAYQSVKLLGITDVKHYQGEQHVFLVDTSLPNFVNAEEVFAIAPEKVQNVKAQIFTAPFTAESGTYVHDSKTIATLNASVHAKHPTKLQALTHIFEDAELTQAVLWKTLKTTDKNLAKYKENAIIDEEMVLQGTPYAENSAAPTVAKFLNQI